MSELAPIALFVYNRPHYLIETLESLAKNYLAGESILYVFSDGPKSTSTELEIMKIDEVRLLIKNVKGFKEVIIQENKNNLGLAKSIISGVSKVLNIHKKIIVLEDDIFVSHFFLQYMNSALDMYKTSKKVLSIGSWNFFSSKDNESETFFCPIPDTIGWATWNDRWELFESDSSKLLAQLKKKNLIKAFNLFGAYNFSGMLLEQSKGNISSWAIRWQATAYLHNKLTLYSKYSFTNHIGIDDSATHSEGVDYSKYITLAEKQIWLVKQDTNLSLSFFILLTERYKSMYGRSNTNYSIMKKILTKIEMYLFVNFRTIYTWL